MALNANAIISVAEAKTQLKITSSSLDSTLEVWINEASDWIENYINNKVVEQSISSEISDGDDDNRLYPRYFPITQLSTESSPTTAQKLANLQYRDSPDSSWTDIESNINHIAINQRDGYIELYDDIFPTGWQNIKISYKAGYVSADVPLEFKTICAEMVQVRYNESKQGNDQLSRSSTSSNQGGGSSSVSYKDLYPRWQGILSKYKNYRLF